MASIHGGIRLPIQEVIGDGSDGCIFPEDASAPVDHGIKPPTQ
ncbi:hypothetical protein [Chryseobacterium sp. T16E-39]|nr:hypothetical protein [Chryseobacterium sp. T16E-39]